MIHVISFCSFYNTQQARNSILTQDSLAFFGLAHLIVFCDKGFQQICHINFCYWVPTIVQFGVSVFKEILWAALLLILGM